MSARGSRPDATADEDPVEGSARVTWYDPERGSWFQTYYDTPATLRAKYLLALEAGTAGIGIWTLGYDAGLDGYPELVGQVFARPVVASVAVDPAVSESLLVHLSAITYDGPAADDRRAGLERRAPLVGPDGRRPCWMRPGTARSIGCSRRGPTATAPSGSSHVGVDGGLSTPVSATVLVDRAAPVIDGLLAAAGPGTGLDRPVRRQRRGWRGVDRDPLASRTMATGPTGELLDSLGGGFRPRPRPMPGSRLSCGSPTGPATWPRRRPRPTGWARP